MQTSVFHHKLYISDPYCPITTIQEALFKFVRVGDDAYLCLYDLDNAIEFLFLLLHLLKHGNC
jgi:hypothetical protein